MRMVTNQANTLRACSPHHHDQAEANNARARAGDGASNMHTRWVHPTERRASKMHHGRPTIAMLARDCTYLSKSETALGCQSFVAWSMSS